MKIKIADFRESPIESDFSEPWSSFEGRDPVDFSLAGPVTGHYRLMLIDEKVLLRMDFHLEMDLACARCLNHFTSVISRHIDMLLYPATLQPEMLELDLQSPDVSFYTGDTVDILDYIWEEMVLNAPMKPLCSADCRGLCPGCGEDLNTSACRCMVKEDNPRWSDLQRLRAKLTTKD